MGHTPPQLPLLLIQLARDEEVDAKAGVGQLQPIGLAAKFAWKPPFALQSDAT
jgi:hypothetical protein